jgi:hypothetical protein
VFAVCAGSMIALWRMRLERVMWKFSLHSLCLLDPRWPFGQPSLGSLGNQDE